MLSWSIGFKKVKWRQLGLSYAFPALSATLIFILLLGFGIDYFGIRSKFIVKFGSKQNVVLMMLLVAPTVGVLSGSLRALGEEIGWRGFLHSRFKKLNVSHPYIIIGAIWALWHIPVILFADYTTSDLPYLSAVLFTIMVICMSIFMGWQREITGSIWPAMITHAVHNTWIQKIYPSFIKKGPLDPYFGGESGVFLVLVYLSVAIYIYKTRLSSVGILKGSIIE